MKKTAQAGMAGKLIKNRVALRSLLTRLTTIVAHVAKVVAVIIYNDMSVVRGSTCIMHA